MPARHKGFTCATSDEIFNFDYTGSLTLPNTHDVGLLILDQPIYLPEYGDLAPVGTLDSLATNRGNQERVFTVSGYGLTYKPNANAPLTTLSFRERLMARIVARKSPQRAERWIQPSDARQWRWPRREHATATRAAPCSWGPHPPIS